MSTYAFSTDIGTVLVNEILYITQKGCLVTDVGILTPMPEVKTLNEGELFYSIDLWSNSKD